MRFSEASPPTFIALRTPAMNGLSGARGGEPRAGAGAGAIGVKLEKKYASAPARRHLAPGENERVELRGILFVHHG